MPDEEPELIRLAGTGVRTPASADGKRIRVLMLDLASIVPYYTGHLAAALEENGDVDVEVASIRYHLDPGYFERQGVRARTGLLDVVSSLRIRSAALRHAFRTLEYLVNSIVVLFRSWKDHIGIVHVQFLPLVKTGLPPLEIWLIRALKRAGVRVIYTAHNVLPQDTGERYRDRYARLYKEVDWLICHDEAARARLVEEFHIDSRRISVIPHGPLFTDSDKPDAEAVRKRLNLPASTCLVLCQGIIRRYKGVDVMLEAWRTIAAANASATLAIVGSGDDELLQEIRDRVDEYKLAGSVRLELRFVSTGELADYLAAADILVYPYREITTSGALMTGISRGKAIIATQLPAFERVLEHGKSGWLVKPGDPSDLAKSLVDLIGNPELRERLGNCAADAFRSGPTWTSIGAETAIAYNQLATSSSKGPLQS